MVPEASDYREGRPIKTKQESPLVRHRALILTGCAIAVLATIAFLVYAQKKSKDYEEAFKRGEKAWKEREADRATTEWRKAAKIDDRDPELWVLIGRAELVAGRPDLASTAWEEALKREPAYKPALFERGKEALGRYVAGRVPPPLDKAGWLSQGLEAGTDEAKKILADLRESAGGGPGYTKFAAGAIHLLDGKYREAQPSLQEYSDQTGWDTTAVALVGIAAHYAINPVRAEAALTAALTKRSEKSWLQTRAASRFLQSNLEGAKADYKEAGLEKETEPLFARRIPSKGLILWLRADAGVEAAGGAVSKWADQSDKHHDAVPKEGAAGPQLTPSALRGRAAILFAGDEGLYLPDGFEDFSAGLSVFVVGEPMTEKTESWSFVFLATAARGAGRIEALVGGRRESDQVVYAAEDLQSQTKPFVAGIAPAKGFESFSAVHEPAGTARLFKRGASAGNGMLILPRKTLRTRNRVGAGLKGHVAEIVLYNRSLTEMERLGVDTYLNDRYFPAPPAEKR
jgi:tetratricopeptide (TPR) repeat protein